MFFCRKDKGSRKFIFDLRNSEKDRETEKHDWLMRKSIVVKNAHKLKKNKERKSHTGARKNQENR